METRRKSEEIFEEEVAASIEPEEEIVAESFDDKSTEVDFLPSFELDEVEEEEKVEEEQIQTKPEEVQISFRIYWVEIIPKPFCKSGSK